MEKIMPVTLGLAFAAILWRIACERARTYGQAMRAFEPLSLGLVFVPVALAGANARTTPDAVAMCILACAGVCAASDRQGGYIFDRVVGLGSIVVAVLVCCSGGVAASVLGALLSGGVLLSLYLLSRRRGLGLGDVKLGALIGGLGPGAGIAAVASAFIIGAVICGTALAMRRIARNEPVPFGPFLAAGTWVTVALRGWSI